MTKRKAGSTAPMRKPWTPEEQEIIRANIAEMGARGIERAGLLPGRSEGSICSHWRWMRGVRDRADRQLAVGALQPVPAFARRHASVWGYAHTVGASA